MAKKKSKKKLTTNQALWEEEYRKLKNRVYYWKRKYHAIPELPEKPKRIYKKDIEELKNFVWRKIPEEKKQEWRKEYARRYEEKSPEVYEKKPKYSPPTEKDYLRNIDRSQNKPPKPNFEEDEDGYKETVVSREEIEIWIEKNIYNITYDRENDGAKELLENLVLEAADAYGDYEGYLNYLESRSQELTTLAEFIIKYHNKNSLEKQEEQPKIQQFATILNLGRPLTPSQSERLENDGWVSFDYND